MINTTAAFGSYLVYRTCAAIDVSWKANSNWNYLQLINNHGTLAVFKFYIHNAPEELTYNWWITITIITSNDDSYDLHGSIKQLLPGTLSHWWSLYSICKWLWQGSRCRRHKHSVANEMKIDENTRSCEYTFFLKPEKLEALVHCIFPKEDYSNKKNLQHWAKTTLSTQLTTMLSTSKNVLLPGHNHLLTTSADDPSLQLPPLLALCCCVTAVLDAATYSFICKFR